ncbi:MAG: endonuclease IV [Methanobacterium sp. PtaU1.Bin242]|nr:MAG: endonuclease IV [Methanobacterium sp. PtaU1.Bin242]
MVNDVRFGPAGNPPGYRGQTPEVCNYIRGRGLEAYEYQATYGVRISKQSALKLRDNSKENNILVSMHAPYYINLSSPKEDVVERSIQRLVQSARAAQWMGAYRIVFHPGFYTEFVPEDAMKKFHLAVNDLTEQLDSLGVSDYTFAPETTGKKSQLGSLEEIIEICRSHENFAPTVDFAHLHARSGGKVKNKDDYGEIFTKLEDELGLKSLHSHFTHIEFTDKGERRHHILSDDSYGPPLEPLLLEIIERGWDVTLICETPLLDEDALLMQRNYRKIQKRML